MQERIAGLEAQLAAVQEVASHLDVVRSQAEELTTAQEHADAKVAAAGEEAERISASLGQLAGKIDRVLSLEEQIDRVEALNAQFGAMSGDANAIRSQIRDLVENMARLRTVHDDVIRVHLARTVTPTGSAEPPPR